MTVSSTIARAQYAGTGSTGPFAFNFKLFDTSHIKVVKTSTGGVDTTLTLTTDYSVSLAADFSSATVTLVSALASGETLTLLRNPPQSQAISWPANDPFPSATHERAADLAVMLIQTLSEILGRVPTLADSSAFSDLIFPDPSASKLLGWNSAGTALENKSALVLNTVVMPGTTVDNELIRADGIDGQTYQTTGVIIDDNKDITGLRDIIGTRNGTFSNLLTSLNVLLSGYLDLTEIAEPASPAINTARVRALDDGNGVTTVGHKDNGGNVVPWSHYAQALIGAITRTQQAKLREWVSIEDFGAVSDGSTDCTSAIQAAIDTGFPVFVPPRDYIVAGSLTLPNNSACIFGTNSGSDGSDFASYPGVSRLIFTGTGTACIKQTTTTGLFLHATFHDICLIADTGATYDWIMDFQGMVNCSMHAIQAQQVDNDSGGILRSVKTAAAISWINRLYDFNFAVPQSTGTQYLIDVDWSDSQVLNGNTDGGKGVIFRGHGNVSIIGVQFNNAVSGEAGLTIRKETTSNGFYPIIGCTFDACTTYGVRVDASADPGGMIMAITFVGCNWRNPGATNDVLFVDGSAATSGVSFDSCKFTDSGVATALSFTASKWNLIFGGSNFFASDYKIPSRTFTPTLAFGGGSTGLTYTTQTGFYRIVDNLVTFELTITLSAKGTSTGAAVVSGLPIAAGQATGAMICQGGNFTGLTGALSATISGGGIILNQSAAAGHSAIADTVFTNTTTFRISGSYLTA